MKGWRFPSHLFFQAARSYPSARFLSFPLTHTGALGAHTHACLGAVLLLLIEVIRKSSFCLSPSFPFSSWGGCWLVDYFLGVCVPVCVCVSWSLFFPNCLSTMSRKFNPVWKINSAGSPFVQAAACCQKQPGCWVPRADLQRNRIIRWPCGRANPGACVPPLPSTHRSPGVFVSWWE